MKDILKMDIKTITIIILVGIIFLMRCGGGEKTISNPIKIDDKKYITINKVTDTLYVTKKQTKYIKGADIEHYVIKNNDIIKTEYVNVDTTEILKKFNEKVVYNDVLVLKDSLGTVSVADTIYQNKILGRTWDTNIKERTITEKTYLKEQPKNQVYIGTNLNVNNDLNIHLLSGGLMLKTKKDKVYQLNVGLTPNNITNTLQPIYGVGMYWKIKLKK
jgi:hypothetical protein